MDVAKIENLFAENFERFGELGASVSIWKNGREAVNLAAGWCDREKSRVWTPQTPVLIYSITKALSAACILHCLEKNGLTLETRVADIWPEFGAAGKEAITLGELLSHRAGSPALQREIDVFDHDAVAAELALQPMLWPRDAGHGYHPRTFGFLLDELVRRLAHVPLGEYWRHEFAQPLGLDTWIGLPLEKVLSVATLYPPRVAPRDDAFLRAFSDPSSITHRAFGSPRGLHTVSSMNTAEARAASFPAFGGISTGNSLAKFFAMLASGGRLDGRRFFSENALSWMSTTLSGGFDKVLQTQTAFSAGFMKDPLDENGVKIRRLFGPSLNAFGQPGAGGSVAFADLERGVSFAYVMNQMEPGVLPNPKSLRLIDALFDQSSM